MQSAKKKPFGTFGPLPMRTYRRMSNEHFHQASIGQGILEMKHLNRLQTTNAK